MTPFALADSSQFASGPPYPLSSKRYADDFNEVKAFGALEDSERSAEQTEIAKFWVESSPLAWNRMARTIAVGRGLDMWESARLFGLLNMGMTDGYIGTFEEKYVYNFWRPVTAIHDAADGRQRRHRRPTPTGSRSCRRRRSPTTTPATASRAAWRRRSCGGCSAPTR